MFVSLKDLLTWFVLVALLLIVSCGKSNTTKTHEFNNFPIYSVDSLKWAFPELSDYSIISFDTSKVIAPYALVVTSDYRYWISADRVESSIILYNQEGSYLMETGRKGRGPGEFEGAKKLHVGWDNNVYVIDMRSQRISQYKVENDLLIYKDTFSPYSSFQPGSQLRTIYVTEWGNYGVLRKIIDYKLGEEIFLLVELDEEFRLKKNLFSMEGNDKMSLDKWNHVDHIAGQKTLWDFDGEWFYHISTHNTVINKYNLKTRSSQSFTHLILEDRKLTEEVKLELMGIVSNMTDRSDEIHKAFVDIESLPLFQDFMVYDNYYYLTIYNPSGSKSTELIRVNEATKEIQYIRLPLNLWKVKAGDKMIYGTVTSGEDAQVRVIYLKG